MPHQLSISELATLTGHWVDAAKRALVASFDVLGIHNAHGYLMHQFLSPIPNTPDDAYGGDFAVRTRFPLEVVEALHAARPKDKPVFVRVSAVDGLDGGWNMDSWPVQYGWWLKHREPSIAQVRADEAAAQKSWR